MELDTDILGVIIAAATLFLAFGALLWQTMQKVAELESLKTVMNNKIEQLDIQYKFVPQIEQLNARLSKMEGRAEAGQQLADEIRRVAKKSEVGPSLKRRGTETNWP
jgi:hypothetical protein